MKSSENQLQEGLSLIVPDCVLPAGARALRARLDDLRHGSRGGVERRGFGAALVHGLARGRPAAFKGIVE